MLVTGEQPEGVLRRGARLEAHELREGGGTLVQGHHRFSHSFHDCTVDELEEPNNNSIGRKRVEIVPHSGEKPLCKAFEDGVFLRSSCQGVELEGEERPWVHGEDVVDVEDNEVANHDEDLKVKRMLRVEALGDLTSPAEPVLDNREWNPQCVEFLNDGGLQPIDRRRVVAYGGLWNTRNEVADDSSNCVQVLFL